MGLVAIDEPVGIAAILSDQPPGVRPAALRAAVIVGQPGQVVAAMDAERLVAGLDRLANDIAGQRYGDRGGDDEELELEDQNQQAQTGMRFRPPAAGAARAPGAGKPSDNRRARRCRANRESPGQVLVRIDLQIAGRCADRWRQLLLERPALVGAGRLGFLRHHSFRKRGYFLRTISNVFTPVDFPSS